MAPIIDKVLGLRCASYGYQYSEIVGSLSSVYFCGGDCVEDVTSHLMPLLLLTKCQTPCEHASQITKSQNNYTVGTLCVGLIVHNF